MDTVRAYILLILAITLLSWVADARGAWQSPVSRMPLRAGGGRINPPALPRCTAVIFLRDQRCQLDGRELRR